MVWALPATMLRPYKQFEDHLNTIFIPCVLETPKTIFVPFWVSRPCKGHAPYNACLGCLPFFGIYLFHMQWKQRCYTQLSGTLLNFCFTSQPTTNASNRHFHFQWCSEVYICTFFFFELLNVINDLILQGSWPLQGCNLRFPRGWITGTS